MSTGTSKISSKMDFFSQMFGKNGAQGDGRPKTVNIFFGFFLMINFVLGTGFLGIPYGFYSGGVLAGIFTLFCITLISWMCAIFVLETMARCQALSDYKEKNDVNVNNGRIPSFRIITDRKFEPSEQCQMLFQFFGIEYFGYGMKVVYLLLLAAITFFACIAYCTVAGPAWAINLPLHFGEMEQCFSRDFTGTIPDGGCQWSYRFCLFLFACVVVPLTLLDLKEQAFVQFLLGIMRFGTVAAIILYCFVHIVMGGLLIDCNGDNPNKFLPHNYSDYLFDDFGFDEANLTNGTTPLRKLFLDYSFSGWLVSIPVFAYAHILHQGIPALTHPIKEKHLLRGYFNLMFLVLGVIYMGLGLVVTIWFRDCTHSTCTMNWGLYTEKKHNPLALRILSYIIILFPSFDVCSAFPLVVHTTVNNIYTVIFGRDTSQDRGLKWGIIQRSMKLVAAVVPICIAMGVSNLVVVLNYAGIIGFFIAFFFPVLLHLRSQWVCFQTFQHMSSSRKKSLNYSKNNDDDGEYSESSSLLRGTMDERKLNSELFEFLFTTKKSALYKTPYSMFFSHPVFAIIIGIISFMTLVFTIASLCV